MTTKKNPWFRMYSDFMFDEKIEFLAFEDQRHYVFILCMKNSGLIDKEYTQPGMLDRVVSKRLGLYGEAFEAAKKRLIESGLIDYKFQPVAWDKRQYLSDSSTERVHAYRERMKQTRNVSVTAQETDTETDTETDKQPAVVKRASKKCPADFEISEDMRTWASLECPTIDVDKATAKFRDHTFKNAMTDWTGAWRNWLRRDAESSPGFGRPAAAMTAAPRRTPPADNFNESSYGQGGKL